MRLINCFTLSRFVRLDPGAEGEYGWLSGAGALLIEAQEMGKVLVGVFSGERPPQFRGLCLHTLENMPPEMDIATLCLRDGISLMGCGLYTRQFPSLSSAVFFARAGINRFFYASGDRQESVINFLTGYGVEITRVNA